MEKTALILAHFNVTPQRAEDIFALFGSDEEFFGEFRSDKNAEKILGDKKYREICPAASEDGFSRLKAFYRASGTEVITEFDEDFPSELSESGEAYALFANGNKSLLKEKSFAVVGTRTISGYGRQAAAFFGSGLSESGVILVGSGSEGAEYSAISAAKSGGIVLCLPNGLGRLTNTQRTLISGCENRLLLSLFAHSTPQMGYNFMINNRLIARLCCGMLLVEAQEGSGAVYTVECGMEFGKEVFALPGEIFSNQSAVPNRLIKELKAGPVTEISDILEKLNVKYKGVVGLSAKNLDGLSDAEKKIIEAIRAGAKRFNDMVEFTGMSVSEVAALLPIMELMDYVRKDGTGEYRVSV